MSLDNLPCESNFREGAANDLHRAASASWQTLTMIYLQIRSQIGMLTTSGLERRELGSMIRKSQMLSPH